MLGELVGWGDMREWREGEDAGREEGGKWGGGEGGRGRKHADGHGVKCLVYLMPEPQTS